MSAPPGSSDPTRAAWEDLRRRELSWLYSLSPSDQRSIFPRGGTGAPPTPQNHPPPLPLPFLAEPPGQARGRSRPQCEPPPACRPRARTPAGADFAANHVCASGAVALALVGARPAALLALRQHPPGQPPGPVLPGLTDRLVDEVVRPWLQRCGLGDRLRLSLQRVVRSGQPADQAADYFPALGGAWVLLAQAHAGAAAAAACLLGAPSRPPPSSEELRDALGDPACGGQQPPGSVGEVRFMALDWKPYAHPSRPQQASTGGALFPPPACSALRRRPRPSRPVRAAPVLLQRGRLPVRSCRRGRSGPRLCLHAGGAAGRTWFRFRFRFRSQSRSRALPPPAAGGPGL